MELRLLTTLLTAPKREQDEFYARQIPKGVFQKRRPEINWLYDYRQTFGAYPTLAAFKHRFPNTELPKTKESLATAAQAILDRATFDAVSKIVDQGREMYEGGQPINNVAGFYRSSFTDLTTHDVQYTDLNVIDNRVSSKRYNQRVLAASLGGATHKLSPWPALNDLIGFLDWGEHTILASRTSLGKTFLALFWADHFRRLGERVLFISKEMPTHQIGDRLESLIYHLPYSLFRKGMLPPAVLGRWKRARKKPLTGTLIVSGHETIQGVGFSHIISKVEQYKPTVLFIDGAYLITPENLNRNHSTVDKLALVSGTIKRICLSKKIIGVSVIQAKREAEDKEGETNVSLKDIYGTDVWAQDADYVLLVSGKRGNGMRRLNLAKGRESAVGEFGVKFQLNPRPDFSQLSYVPMSVYNKGTKWKAIT